MDRYDSGTGHDDCVLITGGTGSFGRAFTEYLLSLPVSPRIRVFSRDEHKQAWMMAVLPPGERLSYILGDVRDATQVHRAMDGVTCLVHAAALKLVPSGERHVAEFTKTNIIGSINVIDAAIERGVTRCLLVSTDKAVAAYNAYGRTKAVAESLFVQANAVGVGSGTRFSVVRGGNVWDSRGSVMEKWRVARAAGRPLEITDPDVTRFHLPMNVWLDFCLHVLSKMRGGEVFVPKLAAWRLGDLAEASGGEVRIIGQRDGDRQHERLIAPEEEARVVDLGRALVVEPSASLGEVWARIPWESRGPGTDFPYTSDSAPRLTVDELRMIIDGNYCRVGKQSGGAGMGF